MTSHDSDSQEQRNAERLILDGVERKVNETLAPRRLALHAGATVQVDGVSDDESVLVEIFAHQGQLKGGQRHKIAGDALKLITLAREREPRPRLILAFADVHAWMNPVCWASCTWLRLRSVRMARTARPRGVGMRGKRRHDYFGDSPSGGSSPWPSKISESRSRRLAMRSTLFERQIALALPDAS